MIVDLVTDDRGKQGDKTTSQPERSRFRQGQAFEAALAAPSSAFYKVEVSTKQIRRGMDMGWKVYGPLLKSCSPRIHLIQWNTTSTTAGTPYPFLPHTPRMGFSLIRFALSFGITPSLAVSGQVFFFIYSHRKHLSSWGFFCHTDP